MYLGAKLQEKEIIGHPCLTISSTVKDYINKDRCKWKLPSKAPTPMVSAFVPELDGTPELEPDDV